MSVKHPDITVKLIGADGNIFNLIGICIKTMKNAGLPVSEQEAFRNAIFNSDSYETAIQVIVDWFEVE